MATATTDDVDAIRRRMAQIRRELHEDVQAVREKAEEATDWRRYLRSYPFAALGIAFAVGFLIVPRKRRSATRTAEKAAEAAVAKMRDGADLGSIGLVTKAEEKKEEKKKGLIGWALGLLAPVAIRAAQGYALKYVETLMDQQDGLGPLAGLLQGGPPPQAGPAGPVPAPPKPTPGPANPNYRRPA